MSSRKAPTVEPKDIPEVIEFIDARDTIEEFKQAHAEVFAKLASLTERYNTSLQQADKACRQREVSCGPFNLYQFTTKYSAEALFNAVGRDIFLEVGGTIQTVAAYDIDKGRLEAAIAQNKITKDVVAKVRKETPNFHKPETLIIP
jgi:hypothetical protein